MTRPQYPVTEACRHGDETYCVLCAASLFDPRLRELAQARRERAERVGVMRAVPRQTCIVKGCESWPLARGLCSNHYKQAQNLGVLLSFPPMRRGS